MPNFIAPGATFAGWASGATGDLIPISTTVRPRQGVSSDVAESVAFPGHPLMGSTFSVVNETAWGVAALPRHTPTQHTDFHYKFWVIPSSLNLSNPSLDADIPFSIWNTFPTFQTVTSVNVVGSSVLSFDLIPGAVVRDFQLIGTNFQIGAGEPTIDATVTFSFTSGDAVLAIRALVASTFSIIPEVPVNEEWEYITDTLMTWNGYESRLSLTAEPRVTIDMKITLVDFDDRRELYDLVKTAIRVPALVPFFQYATPLTANTLLGASRLYFNPVIANCRVDSYVAVINRVTREVVLGQVSIVHADGVTIDSAVGQDLFADPPLWFAMPSHPCEIKDGSGLTFGTQAGSFSLKANVLTDFTVERPDAVRVVNTFDSLPVLEWPMLITTDEKFSYRREIMDGGVGIRTLRSRDIPVNVSRTFKFSADRLTDDLDYFRKFFKTVRGSQKPFLMTTQLPDLKLGAAFAQGASTLTLDKSDYVSKFFPFDAFKRLEVTYGNGSKSYHLVTSAAIDGLGVATISFSPSLTNTPAHTVITRISYLQKCKASDNLILEHFNDYSYVRFKAQTVEF